MLLSADSLSRRVPRCPLSGGRPTTIVGSAIADSGVLCHRP